MQLDAIRRQRVLERAHVHRAASPLRGNGVAAATLMIFLFGASMAPDSLYAVQSASGEAGATWFFRLTHLPLAVYVILFLIFILSVLNLWYQSWRAVERIGPRSLSDLLKDLWRGRFESSVARMGRHAAHRPRGKRHHQSSFRMGSEAVVVSEVVGAPRLSSQAPAHNDHDLIPTPLNGIDHPLPRFEHSATGGRDHKEKAAAGTEQDGKSVSFKFSSAVDVPTQEEIDRRDKAQLVVSGFVTGPDGRGLPSVLVYLTDLEGNRVGQSCRTLAETGEYKVLVNEPGKYILRAHKRGMMMENTDGVSLPMESGKIEGLNFSMIPDGCVVKGRVLLSDTLEPVPHTAIRCRSRLGDYTGESVSDADGYFSIVGAPPNCECYVEVIDASGRRVHATEQFETVQKNQVSLDIRLKQAPSSPVGSNRPSAAVPKMGGRAEETSRPTEG